jgi:uncharacterized membrane protein YebE (DUF533 family)
MSSGHGQAPGRPESHVGKYATGAAVGGALGLLLGSRGGRRMGGKALKYGSVAALGALAWKVYQDHQAKQAQPTGPAASPGMGTPMPAAQPAVPSFQALPAPQVEQHSQAMLKAMIAAAKADGHMDERETQLVHEALDRLAADAETRRWVDAELRRPVDPAEVARLATTPELAAEIYLASVVVVDETTTMERAYLDALARELRLDAGLRADLEARAAAV